MILWVKLNEKLLSLQSKMDDLNLWDLESDAKTVLMKLGIKVVIKLQVVMILYVIVL